MPSVRLDELRKEFGTTVAVDDISVEFHDGKLTSILGPSGCGKTTTLNLIAGFIDPDGGTIRFGEQLIADATRGMVVPPNRRNLGMVFQSYALWPHLSVADNVAYGLKMRRMARQRRDETVRRALQRVRLGQYLDRFPHELSGGQQQRVALARAIAYAPQILLFDEPLSNLDAQLREEMRLELKDIHHEIGVTAVYVTHDQGEAMSLSDRIAIMGEGRILQIGSPRELYEEPADVRVAQFLGRTNLFDACLVEAAHPLARVRIDGSDEIVTCRGPRLATPNMRGSLSVRPGAIALASPGAGATGLSGHIRAAMYLGHSVQLQVTLASGRTLEVHSTRQAWNVGDAVSVAFDAEQCYFIAGGTADARFVS
jgi:iron(III) transport system ATP-binding protein